MAAASRNAVRNAATDRSLRVCVPCAKLQRHQHECQSCGGKTSGCASAGEARRLRDLALLQKAGHICELEPHPRYPLMVGEVDLGVAIFDASYRLLPPSGGAGRRSPLVVEDVKGERSPDDELSRLKRGLVKGLYDIEVRLVLPSGKPWTPRRLRRRAKR